MKLASTLLLIIIGQYWRQSVKLGILCVVHVEYFIKNLFDMIFGGWGQSGLHLNWI